MNINSQNPYAAPQTVDLVDPASLEKHAGSELATRGQRLGGHCIDGILIVILLMPLIVVFAVFFPDYFVESTSTQTELIFEIAATFAMFVGFAVCNAYLLITRGQTIGKYFMGTQIVDEYDELVPFARIIFIRYLLVWVIASVPLIGRIFNIANALAIFRENHKCLHDDFCRTKVIKFREPTHATVRD